MSLESNNDAPKSIQEIWKDAILRFQERTGYALGSSISMSPEDLRRALDLHYGQQAGDEKTAKAKDMGLKIISCIQLLGGMAADGVSGVFAPAPLCFKALSFLLDIPKKIHEFHGEINAIFEEVGPAIAQFRIYQRIDDNTGIDEFLRASIYEVMVSFVDICANCINIQKEGRWKSLKRNAKRVLLDDRSVQAELENFKTLTQRQLNTQATLTLEAALDTKQYVAFIKTTTVEIESNTKAIKTDVSSLVETDQKRTLDETRKKQLTTIKAKLGIKDDQIGRVMDERENIWKSSIEHSGTWLSELDQYKQWIDETNPKNLLLLTGDSGTGKSHLVSAIFYQIKEIKSGNLTSKAERTLVGYYSFSLAAKENKRRPETAVKLICAQLAEQDSVYAKNVAAICGEKDEKLRDTAECRDLWEMLAIDSPAKNTTHYIILDSIGSLDGPELDRLIRAIKYKPAIGSAEEEKSLRVRILITGEPDTFQSGNLDVTVIPTIDITQHNRDDIALFIEKELQNTDLFQGDDEDSKRLKNTVQERLLERSNNSYFTVRKDLENIKEISNSSGTEEELNRFLQESNAGLEELVRLDIESLEATLRPREIDEVNELLVWIVAGFVFFSFEELTAALFLRFKTVPLQPLSQKITSKYSKLFNLAYGWERPVIKDLVENHVVVHRDKQRESADDPKITATITISNASVKAAQRFFWDLNHHSFLEGFAFQPGSQFYETTPAKIQVYVVDAHFEIIKRAFEFFSQTSIDDRAKGIGYYLMAYIPSHLRSLYEATGFDELQEKDKQYIASCITEMFSVGDWIEKSWDYRGWTQWYCDKDDIAVFWKWLDDPKATSHLGSLGKSWLAQLKNEENRNRALLTPIMKTIARHWLQDGDWDPLDAYTWIKGFLEIDVAEPVSNEESKIEPSGETDEYQSGDDSEEEETHEDQSDDDSEEEETTSDESTNNMIKKAEEWCKQVLKVSQMDYTWHSRLGRTFARSYEFPAAIEEYIQAATILKSQDPVDKEKLCDVYKSLGEWSADAETSLGYYKQALEQDTCVVEIMYAMCKRYLSVGKADEAQPIILKIVTEKISDPESTSLSELLKSASDDENGYESLKVFMAIILSASTSPELWPVVEGEIERAIRKAREEGNQALLPTLLFNLGISAYTFREQGSREELRRAVAYWRECLVTLRQIFDNDPSDLLRLQYVETRVVDYLSMAYFEQQEEVPIELFKSDWAFPETQHVVASHYTRCGQRSEARNLLRPKIVEAFNVFSDGDISNDGWGFYMLSSVLNSTGDFENAHKANLLSPTLRFDGDALQALLASNDGVLDEASRTIFDYHQSNCLGNNDPKRNLRKVLGKVNRLVGATDGDSENVSPYKAILDTLTYLGHIGTASSFCDNCNANWDYETSIHTCKMCFNVDLCGSCLDKLQSAETIVPVCNKAHDWLDRGTWTIERYVQACKKLVPVKHEDGSIERVTISQWLGGLCEEWGLSKADWEFD
ncbi:Eukaryotic translation initiation factor 3 subunit A [Talaromyces islandicus]|uniref:Eukaryotic translation initiation factor 3 subunit A n=1 Tax=Talaromyces islandicus TaxID=28573 RepID=A0A0U1LZ41_TALIS|nr:Eukaryotic translation initiation factor 3 subunit A [Talaromyces islandicus]